MKNPCTRLLIGGVIWLFTLTASAQGVGYQIALKMHQVDVGWKDEVVTSP